MRREYQTMAVAKNGDSVGWQTILLGHQIDSGISDEQTHLALHSTCRAEMARMGMTSIVTTASTEGKVVIAEGHQHMTTLPTNVVEAEAMQKVSYARLRDHAPERLIAPRAVRPMDGWDHEAARVGRAAMDRMQELGLIDETTEDMDFVIGELRRLELGPVA